MIVSYYPQKVKKILDFFRVLSESKNESKKDIINCLKKIGSLDILKSDNLESKNNSLVDHYLDKIIFKTFIFIDLVMDINEGLIITLLGEIFVNTCKIKSFDLVLKLGIFLMYIKESTDVIQKNKNSQVYLKIVEICGGTTKIINSYLS